jgi:hypothetical protein
MDNGLIAIIGSADEKRTYNPPMEDHASARRTAELLGKSLGERGFRIVVYNASPNFIEGDTVRGFVQAKNAKRGSIVLEKPLGQKGADGFPEYATHSYVFLEHQDASKSWEVSFYRSLYCADGVALIGGAQSTLVAGMVALTQSIPLVAFPAFGGKAQEVWQKLREGGGLATEADANAIANSELEVAVEAAVRSLEAQKKERHRRQSVGPERKAKLGAAALLAAWPCLLAVGAILRPPQANPLGQVPSLFWILLLVGPLVSGASGATIRALGPGSEGVTTTNLVRGTAAGLVCAIFYLIAQLSAIAANGTVTFLTLLIEFAMAFVGGYTADQVLSQLSELRALRKHALDPAGKEHVTDQSASQAITPSKTARQKPKMRKLG